MSEEKPKVRYRGSESCRFVGMAQSSSCQTIPEMCNLKWPGLHVCVNRRNVCFANEWVPAHPSLHLNAFKQHSTDWIRREVDLLTRVSMIVSRNANYTMIVICGFFLCRNGTTLCPQRRNCRSDKERKWRWRTRIKTNVAVLFLLFSMWRCLFSHSTPKKLLAALAGS